MTLSKLNSLEVHLLNHLNTLMFLNIWGQIHSLSAYLEFWSSMSHVFIFSLLEDILLNKFETHKFQNYDFKTW